MGFGAVKDHNIGGIFLTIIDLSVSTPDIGAGLERGWKLLGQGPGISLSSQCVEIFFTLVDILAVSVFSDPVGDGSRTAWKNY